MVVVKELLSVNTVLNLIRYFYQRFIMICWRYFCVIKFKLNHTSSPSVWKLQNFLITQIQFTVKLACYLVKTLISRNFCSKAYFYPWPYSVNHTLGVVEESWVHIILLPNSVRWVIIWENLQLEKHERKLSQAWNMTWFSSKVFFSEAAFIFLYSYAKP